MNVLIGYNMGKIDKIGSRQISIIAAISTENLKHTKLKKTSGKNPEAVSI